VQRADSFDYRAWHVPDLEHCVRALAFVLAVPCPSPKARSAGKGRSALAIPVGAHSVVARRQRATAAAPRAGKRSASKDAKGAADHAP
jgi:hypothetical protein